MEHEIFEAFGLYEGEPGPVEILQRKAFHVIHGPNHLAISHQCPACGGEDTEWVRNTWSICYPCELAFEGLERYTDLTVDEEMEEQENER